MIIVGFLKTKVYWKTWEPTSGVKGAAPFSVRVSIVDEELAANNEPPASLTVRICVKYTRPPLPSSLTRRWRHASLFFQVGRWTHRQSGRPGRSGDVLLLLDFIGNVRRRAVRQRPLQETHRWCHHPPRSGHLTYLLFIQLAYYYNQGPDL